MKNSQKMLELSQKAEALLKEIDEAADMVMDHEKMAEDYEATKKELIEAKSEIYKLQKQVIELMKADNQNLHLQEIKLRAKELQEAMPDVSEKIIWGCFAGACRNCLIPPTEFKPVELIEPIEPAQQYQELTFEEMQAIAKEQPFDRSKLKVGDFVQYSCTLDIWEILRIEPSECCSFLCKCIDTGNDESTKVGEELWFSLATGQWRKCNPKPNE